MWLCNEIYAAGSSQLPEVGCMRWERTDSEQTSLTEGRIFSTQGQPLLKNSAAQLTSQLTKENGIPKYIQLIQNQQQKEKKNEGQVENNKEDGRLEPDCT